MVWVVCTILLSPRGSDLHRFADPSGVCGLPGGGTEACADDMEGGQEGGCEERGPIGKRL